MDSLTHSLFGAAVAEAYIQKRKLSVTKKQRAWLYGASILANNCPDIDLLLGFVDNTTIGYLLNHRGWTHTLIGALLQSLVLLLFFFCHPHKKDLWILSLIGCQTHILLDFLNSYGVHPFWPVNTKWYFLDSIFIIEPLLWITLSFLWIRKNLWSWVLLAPILLAYFYGWTRGLIEPSTLLTPLLLALFCGWLYQKKLSWHKSYFSLVGFFGVVFVFWSHQQWARATIENTLKQNTTTKTLELVLSPLPSDPSCWFFLAPQILDGEYQVIAGSQRLYGKNSRCHNFSQTVWKASIQELAPYLARCDVAAWFQFARVPFWKDNILNDLRFAIRNAKNFSSFEISNQAPICPPIPAPWTPPRQDLLDFIKLNR
ncbi:metal-dependent hydrolase [bacterium]|nr:metal-dependent hydrolase [bacterium]